MVRETAAVVDAQIPPFGFDWSYGSHYDELGTCSSLHLLHHCDLNVVLCPVLVQFSIVRRRDRSQRRSRSSAPSLIEPGTVDQRRWIWARQIALTIRTMSPRARTARTTSPMHMEVGLRTSAIPSEKGKYCSSPSPMAAERTPRSSLEISPSRARKIWSVRHPRAVPRRIRPNGGSCKSEIALTGT